MCTCVYWPVCAHAHLIHRVSSLSRRYKLRVSYIIQGFARLLLLVSGVSSDCAFLKLKVYATRLPWDPAGRSPNRGHSSRIILGYIILGSFMLVQRYASEFWKGMLCDAKVMSDDARWMDVTHRPLPSSFRRARSFFFFFLRKIFTRYVKSPR